jgi:hypothetical protein
MNVAPKTEEGRPSVLPSNGNFEIYGPNQISVLFTSPFKATLAVRFVH